MKFMFPSSELVIKILTTFMKCNSYYFTIILHPELIMEFIQMDACHIMFYSALLKFPDVLVEKTDEKKGVMLDVKTVLNVFTLFPKTMEAIFCEVRENDFVIHNALKTIFVTVPKDDDERVISAIDRTDIFITHHTSLKFLRQLKKSLSGKEDTCLHVTSVNGELTFSSNDKAVLIQKVDKVVSLLCFLKSFFFNKGILSCFESDVIIKYSYDYPISIEYKMSEMSVFVFCLAPLVEGKLQPCIFIDIEK
jgi:hypothetical protein